MGVKFKLQGFRRFPNAKQIGSRDYEFLCALRAATGRRHLAEPDGYLDPALAHVVTVMIRRGRY